MSAEDYIQQIAATQTCLELNELRALALTDPALMLPQFKRVCKAAAVRWEELQAAKRAAARGDARPTRRTI